METMIHDATTAGLSTRSRSNAIQRNQLPRCSAEEYDEEIQLPFVFLVRDPKRSYLPHMLDPRIPSLPFGVLPRE